MGRNQHKKDENTKNQNAYPHQSITTPHQLEIKHGWRMNLMNSQKQASEGG